MNGISNKVSLTEGNIQNIDDENVTVAVSTDVPKELDKVEKDDKQSFEEFKTLYKDVITMKCKQDFGDCEDQKLWEDAAKELFLQSKNYILDGEEFKSKENLQEEPEKEKKTENVMVTPQVIKENNENEFDNIKPGDEFINDSGSKIVMLEPTETDEYNFKIINTNTNEEGTGKFSCTFMRDLLKDNHYKKVESNELDESINNEPKNELNATEFVSLIDNLKKMDLWDGKDETFKDAVEKYYSILDTQSKLKNEGTILSEEQLREEADSLEFKYQLLDRLKSDCEYFLKAGNRAEKHLWAGNVDDQIAKMKELWNSLEEKPEWLSMEDIENYEKEMKQDTVEESKIEEIKTTSENTKNYDAIDYFWQDEDIKTIQELIGEAANVSIDETDKAVLNIKAPQTKYINGGIINGSDVLIDAITEYVHKQYPEVEIKVINSGTTFILQDKVTWKSKKDITEESKKIQESQVIEESMKEKTTLEEDKFFNLYQSFNNLYGINKMNPNELIEFINDLKKMNRISDKDFNVMNDYANKWQDLINKTGYESSIANESKEIKTEDQYEAERRKGRPNLDKIAKEVFEYDDYYINIVDNYKDEWDFVKDNVAEVAAEYNLREQAAEAVMRKIYKMAKDAKVDKVEEVFENNNIIKNNVLKNYITNNNLGKTKLRILSELDRYRLTEEEMEYCLDVDNDKTGSDSRSLAKLLVERDIDLNKAKELYNGSDYKHKYCLLLLLSYNINETIIKNVLNTDINYFAEAMDYLLKENSKNPISDEQLNFILTKPKATFHEDIFAFYKAFTDGLELEMAKYIAQFNMPYTSEFHPGYENIALKAATNLAKNDAKLFLDEVLIKYFKKNPDGVRANFAGYLLNMILNNKVSLQDICTKAKDCDNLEELYDQFKEFDSI